ncbi:hypothetical protein SLE2022_235900 [Rubroshorea leprosula]
MVWFLDGACMAVCLVHIAWKWLVPFTCNMVIRSPSLTIINSFFLNLTYTEWMQLNFLRGALNLAPPLPRLNGQAVRVRVDALPDILFRNPSTNQTIPGFGEPHNWVKRSILWELPYSKDNLTRHNLDAMHCEKNFFDNIIHTVMDDPFSKDNVKPRMDLPLYCDREELHSYYDRRGSLCKPNASYALNMKEKRRLCTWLKHVRFPDGFTSNSTRCVNLHELRLVRMKNHDCHIFM